MRKTEQVMRVAYETEQRGEQRHSVVMCVVLQRDLWSSARSLAEWQPASLTDKLAAGKLTYVTLTHVSTTHLLLCRVTFFFIHH